MSAEEHLGGKEIAVGLVKTETKTVIGHVIFFLHVCVVINISSCIVLLCHCVG